MLLTMLMIYGKRNRARGTNAHSSGAADKKLLREVMQQQSVSILAMKANQNSRPEAG
jgi:hypothetical protein